jgi:hypothetical protein
MTIGHIRQDHREGRAASGARLRPHLPPMARHDEPHHREPRAGAGKFVGVMQPLEHLEEAMAVRHVESRPVVSNPIFGIPIVLAAANLDLRRLRARAELERVLDEVRQRGAKERLVALHRRHFPHRHAGARVSRLEDIHDLLGEHAHLHALHLQRMAANLVQLAKRRLQLGRDCIGKHLELLVGALELGGKLRHAALQPCRAPCDHRKPAR